jgi:hypothetical protein
MGNSSSSTLEYGWHVLQVLPNSPGEKAGLEAYFDFIVGANGHQFDKEDATFATILKENINKEVILSVYSVKTEKLRDVILIPSNNWGGEGVGGMSVRFCSLSQATEHVWHVLEVQPASPAALAGLNAHTDYIVGTPDILFNSKNDFFTFITNNVNKTVSLYVYSSVTEKVRIVTITPKSNWGGSGFLGCDIGYGYIHRIPMRKFLEKEKEMQTKNQPMPNVAAAVATATGPNTNIPVTLQTSTPTMFLPNSPLTTATNSSPSIANPPTTQTTSSPSSVSLSSQFHEMSLDELKTLPQYYQQQVTQSQVVNN